MITASEINADSATQSSPVGSGAESDLSIEVCALNTSFRDRHSQSYQTWNQLFEHDPQSHIQQHPDHVSAEVGQLPDGASRPLIMVTARREETVVGIAILIPKSESIRHFSQLIPAMSFSGYRMAGSRILGVHDDEVARAILQACLASTKQHRGRFLLIEDLIEGSDLWRCCQSIEGQHGLFFLPEPPQKRLFIRFPKDVDYWSAFSSKSRWNFRRKIRKFGDHRLERVTDISQLSVFLEDAHRISQNSWQTRSLGLRIRNDDAELKLFTFLALEGALRSYVLYHGDQPAAFLCGTQRNGYFDFGETAYDQDLSHVSPGHVLILKILEDLIAENTPECLDFGEGDAEYKRIFGNDEANSADVWLMPGGLMRGPLRWLSVSDRLFYRFADWCLNTLGIKDRVKKMLRRSTAAQK